MIVDVHIDADTERYLRAAAKDHGATIEWLASAAVSESALQYAKDNDLIDYSGRRRQHPATCECPECWQQMENGGARG